MIRGTTPTHSFTINIDTALIEKLLISYAQDDTEIITKDKDDCVLQGNTIACTLSQEDTLKFNCKKAVMIQLKVKTVDGAVAMTDIITTTVGKCLNDEVI